MPTNAYGKALISDHRLVSK